MERTNPVAVIALLGMAVIPVGWLLYAGIEALGGHEAIGITAAIWIPSAISYLIGRAEDRYSTD